MKGRSTFKGGVHPLPGLHHGKKFTEHKAIEVLPAPKIVSIPCAQHIGAPANPIVKPGDEVKMGQRIAEPTGFVSVPAHASVSGKVLEVKQKKNKVAQFVTNIVIENDFNDEISPELVPHKGTDEMSAKEIRDMLLNCGNVGLGGAGFPTHVKFAVPEGKSIKEIIVNAAECEPFLTADHRLMLEDPQAVIYGLKALLKAGDAQMGYIAIEDNKPDAIAAIKKANDTDKIVVCALETKYPQGSEKQLIEAVTCKQVPSGGLPLDVGVVVVNVGSVAAVATEIKTGMPLIERIVTVTGAFSEPKNIRARLGTPIKELIEFCGGLGEDVKRIVAGGPMMGVTLDHIEGVVTKTTSGILALTDAMIQPKEDSNCIRCGRCTRACPMHLQPLHISAAADMYDFDKAEKYFAMDCMGCGCCSYVCPANRYLAQSIRMAKDGIMKNWRKC